MAWYSKVNVATYHNGLIVDLNAHLMLEQAKKRDHRNSERWVWFHLRKRRLGPFSGTQRLDSFPRD